MLMPLKPSAREKTDSQGRISCAPDPVAVTPDDMSLMVGYLMSRRDIDWLPVVESKDDRRLIGVVPSEKMLRWPVEQS
jgi:CBS domain-containing protein